MSDLIVAVDGPAGSGKSSVSREAARRLGFAYLDTGAAYRALAWHCLDEGVDVEDAVAVAARVPGFDYAIGMSPDRYFVRVGGEDITPDIREPRVTAVVAPDAAVRVLLTASPEARMARRSAELGAKPTESMTQQLASRDAQDLKVVDFMNAAEGVTTLDSTELDFEQTVQALIDIVRARPSA